MQPFKRKFLDHTTTLVFSNEDLNDILKIVKFLGNDGLLMKGVSETGKIEVKEQKGGFMGMLAAKLGANFLSSILTGKGVIQAAERTIRDGKETIRAGQDL